MLQQILATQWVSLDAVDYTSDLFEVKQVLEGSSMGLICSGEVSDVDPHWTRATHDRGAYPPRLPIGMSQLVRTSSLAS